MEQSRIPSWCSDDYFMCISYRPERLEAMYFEHDTNMVTCILSEINGQYWSLPTCVLVEISVQTIHTNYLLN